MDYPKNVQLQSAPQFRDLAVRPRNSFTPEQKRLSPFAGEFHPGIGNSSVGFSPEQRIMFGSSRKDSMEPKDTNSMIKDLERDVEDLRNNTIRELYVLRQELNQLQRREPTIQWVSKPVNDDSNLSAHAIKDRMMSTSKGLRLLANGPSTKPPDLVHRDDSPNPPEQIKDVALAPISAGAREVSTLVSAQAHQDTEVPSQEDDITTEAHEKPLAHATAPSSTLAKPDTVTTSAEAVNEEKHKKPPLSKKPPEADEPVPSVEDPALNSRFQPLVVRSMEPLPEKILARIPDPASMGTFSCGYLRRQLDGIEFSPGYFYVPPSHGSCILDTRAYYCIDAENDPFLPPKPGAHGAKLIPFLRVPTEEDHPDEENLIDCPVFIRVSKFAKDAGKNEQEYLYFGNYSQKRFSDRLDYDRMVEDVPHSVKMHWAEKLSDMGRPDWVTTELMELFYKNDKPDPPTGKSLKLNDVMDYTEELRHWEEDGREKVMRLSKESILRAFETADGASRPGLRLWWEYLQCVNYDVEFHYALLAEQELWRHGRR